MATLPKTQANRLRPSVADVARLARVGTTTVSRVMNGSALVTGETRERVLDAVRVLGYVPNVNARKFRTGRTRTVSLILPMHGTDFYTQLVDGLDSVLDDAGYDLALFPLLTPKRLERYLNGSALPYQADAVLLASLDPARLFPTGRVPTDLPVVLADMASPFYSSLAVDNHLGGRMAADRLGARPAETFVIQVEEWSDTPFSSGVFRQRLDGFRSGLDGSGAALPDTNVVTVEFSWGGGRVAMADILARARPPINVFASCDLMAIGALDEVLHAGLSIGEDVRIIGFDDTPWAAERDLTTIRQPIEELGRATAEEVIKRIETNSEGREHRTFAPTLQCRGSA